MKVDKVTLNDLISLQDIGTILFASPIVIVLTAPIVAGLLYFLFDWLGATFEWSYLLASVFSTVIITMTVTLQTISSKLKSYEITKREGYE